jgi:hypothetical protein
VRSDAAGRIARSVLQFVAGGGITLIISAIADGLSTVAAAILLAVNTLAVTIAQNLAEAKGVIRPLFKPVPVSELVDTTGAVVGEVTGMVPADIEEVTGTVFSDEGKVVGGVGPIDEEEDPDT